MNAKRKFTKILGIGLTIALLISLLMLASPATALSQPEVIITPITATIGEVSQYDIVFTAGKLAAAGYQIVIAFPAGTYLGAPGAYAGGTVNIEALAGIGGDAFTGAPASAVVSGVYPDAQSLILTLGVGQNIGAGALVCVTIPGIVNTFYPGDYTLTVATQTAALIPIEDAVTSAPFTINVPSLIPLPGVVTAYNSAGIAMAQGTSINNCILVAGVGGTVEVGPGTYDEAVECNVACQTITGIGDPGTVIISDADMFGTGGTVMINVAGTLGTGVTLENLTITPNPLVPQADMVTLTDIASYVTIKDCTIGSGTTSAVTIATGSTNNAIADCAITAQHATSARVGIITDGQVAITGTTINVGAGQTTVAVQITDTSGVTGAILPTSVTDCTITGSSGLGIMIGSGSVIVKDSTLRSLTDAINLNGSTGITIADNNITNNDRGIHLCNSSGNILTNNVVAANNVCGIHFSDSSNFNMLVNNTVAFNGDYGILVGIDSTGNDIKNAILWGNGDDLDGGTATYSNISDGDPGEGNISQEPMFIDYASNDYHLQADSPCIDVGDNDSVLESMTTDFEGDPRVLDGDFNATATVDMGADEYYPCPDIRTPVDPVNFYGVTVGNTLELTTTIYNDGVLTLSVDSITRASGSDDFTYVVPATPFDIGAGESRLITVRFIPTSEGSKNATYNINSNDPRKPVFTFDTLGYGVMSLLRGDANGDGSVNVLDMTKIARIILGLD